MLFNGIRTESSTYLITPNDTSKLTQYVFKDLGVIGSSPQIQFRSPSAGEDLDFEIKDLKVEFGSVATKYQPNPRDIYGENDINQSTNISARSSVDNKIVDSNELSLYNSFKGKNLLRNTSETIKNNNYRIADYPLTEDLKDGDIVTITVKGQLGADKSALLFYNSGGYVRALNTNDKNYKYQMEKSGFDSNNIQTITGVWQTKSNTRESSNTSLYLYAYPNSGTSESQIEWIKLERGTESTPYQRAPEDSPGFLNKTIRFYGTRIDLDTITVDTTNNIPYAKIQYSQDNKNWYTIKTINNLNTSISVLNDTVDLYGLNLVNYRNITPFSNVTLNSIYRVKLKDLTSQGTVTDIPFGFFNARDTIVNYFGTIQANNMKIVKDTVNGMLDKSSGGIVRVSPPTISGFEKINVSNDILESETNVKINLGLPYSIDKLSDTKLSETEYLETRIPKIL
nr:virion structural protein [Staphylococcus phage S-CoN_Ph38]